MNARMTFALLLLLAVPVKAEWQANPDDELQVAAAAALDDIRAAGGDDFDARFEESHAFAVFPRLVRTGLVVGWASGRGILVVDGRFEGYVRQRRFSLGAQVGRQTQGQVILFRDRETVELFKAGGLEFTPQASTHVRKPRRAADGNFRPSVAVYSLSQKGLMAEAAIGTTAFSFKEPE
jgi:lipid-binding SYLF domain-containing protein